MKKLFLFFTVLGFFVLSSCGSTQNCRTRTTAQTVEKIQQGTPVLALADSKK